MTWRKVKDEPMPEDELILVGLFVIHNNEYEYFSQHVAKVNYEDQCMETPDGDDIGWQKEDITHWMPLPEPPEK